MNKQNDTSSSFDFDDWMQLSKDNPGAFEAKRQQLIEDLIEGVSEHSKRRLQGLQWQIDTIRQQSGTPMAACLKISAMMWKNLQGEDGLLDNLNRLAGNPPVKEKRRMSADVIQLQQRFSQPYKKPG